MFRKSEAPARPSLPTGFDDQHSPYFIPPAQRSRYTELLTDTDAERDAVRRMDRQAGSGVRIQLRVPAPAPAHYPPGTRYSKVRDLNLGSEQDQLLWRHLDRIERLAEQDDQQLRDAQAEQRRAQLDAQHTCECCGIVAWEGTDMVQLGRQLGARLCWPCRAAVTYEAQSRAITAIINGQSRRMLAERMLDRLKVRS